MKKIIVSALLSLTAINAQASEFSDYKSWLLDNIGSYEQWSNKQKKKYKKLAAKEVVTNWEYKNKWKPGYFRFHHHTYNWGITKTTDGLSTLSTYAGSKRIEIQSNNDVLDNEVASWGFKLRTDDISQYKDFVSISQLKGGHKKHWPTVMIRLTDQGEVIARIASGTNTGLNGQKKTYISLGSIESNETYQIDLAALLSDNEDGWFSGKITNTSTNESQTKQKRNLAVGFDGNANYTYNTYGIYRNDKNKHLDMSVTMGEYYTTKLENTDILSDHTFITNEGTGIKSTNTSSIFEGYEGFLGDVASAHANGYRGKGTIVVHSSTDSNINAIADEATNITLANIGTFVNKFGSGQININPIGCSSICASINLDSSYGETKIDKNAAIAAGTAIIWSKYDTLNNHQISEIATRTATDGVFNLSASLSPVGNLK